MVSIIIGLTFILFAFVIGVFGDTEKRALKEIALVFRKQS